MIEMKHFADYNIIQKFMTKYKHFIMTTIIVTILSISTILIEFNIKIGAYVA